MPTTFPPRMTEAEKENMLETAQSIYVQAFRRAYREYLTLTSSERNSSRETYAHHAAWRAVKEQYRIDREGNWTPRYSHLAHN